MSGLVLWVSLGHGNSTVGATEDVRAPTRIPSKLIVATKEIMRSIVSITSSQSYGLVW